MSQFSQVIDSLNLIQLTIKARVFILNWYNSSMSSESPQRIPTHILISQVWGGSRFGISSNLLEKAMAPHSSTLAWKIPWTEGPGRLQSMGSLRVGHDWATSLSLFTFMFWRRKWQPTPVFLPGESQGQQTLVGYYLWGRTESDTTEET